MTLSQSSPAFAYQDLQQAIQAEKARRISEHQAQIAAQRRMERTMAKGAPTRLNLLAQGDSWFDYPLPVPVLDQSDVVAHLRRLPRMAPLVMSLAHAGEAAEAMLGVTKLHELVDQLEDPQANGNYDAILFSGGGNDLAGDQFRLWLADFAACGGNPAKALNTDRVTAILAVVRAGYEDLIIARDQYAPSVPIFAHSYDFAIPNGTKVACAGPWLQPSFTDRSWLNVNVNRGIVKELLLQFAEMLNFFETKGGGKFVHVRTQGTLKDTQWWNELHPNPDGFAAVSAKFVEALSTKFPGRI